MTQHEVWQKMAVRFNEGTHVNVNIKSSKDSMMFEQCYSLHGWKTLQIDPLLPCKLQYNTKKQRQKAFSISFVWLFSWRSWNWKRKISEGTCTCAHPITVMFFDQRQFYLKFLTGKSPSNNVQLPKFSCKLKFYCVFYSHFVIF